MARPLVIGIGQPYRGDDAAGLTALERLAEASPQADLCPHHGEGLGLMALWEGREQVILIDAAESGAPPGTLHRLQAGAATGDLCRTSSHAFGVHQAIETARVLDRLPPRLIVHAVEGAEWTLGAPLTPAVANALPALVQAVLADLPPTPCLPPTP